MICKSIILHLVFSGLGSMLTQAYIPNGYIGCYVDTSDRILNPNRIVYEDTNSGDKCKETCKSSGFRYAGTEYANECFCGNAIKPSQTANGCTMPCTGRSDEICGGAYHISLYDTREGIRCSAIPCQNGGTCDENSNGYSCVCKDGYSGIFCENDIDECSFNFCANGGQCKDLTNGFMCLCASGFSGKHCENDIDECLSTPCANGATCNDMLNGYTCSCASGFTDTRCAREIDECYSEPCQNGATCNDMINGYKCSCAPGYTDFACSLDLPCPLLQLDSNTNVLYTNGTYNGSTASFYCVEGYYLREKYSLVCQGWIWSGQPPSCQNVHFPDTSSAEDVRYIATTSGLSAAVAVLSVALFVFIILKLRSRSECAPVYGTCCIPKKKKEEPTVTYTDLQVAQYNEMNEYATVIDLNPSGPEPGASQPQHVGDYFNTAAEQKV